MGIIEEYLKDHTQVGIYGIKYLDEKLAGIMNDDLVLIGARSGAGKSTIANIIAQSNSEKGTPVALFTLENFTNQDLFVSTFYEYKKRANKPYWKIRGMLAHWYDKEIDYDLLRATEEDILKKWKNVFRITRQQGYDLNKLKDDLYKYANKGIKIAIIDHLDYVDTPKDAFVSENFYMSEIMSTLREFQDNTGVGIVAFSHLRKHQNKFIPLVPSMDEFIGSSNKTKQATEVIMFAPDEKTNLKNSEGDLAYLKSTFCCIRKSRLAGNDNKVAKMKFDIRTNSYVDENIKGMEYGVSFDGLNIYDEYGSPM